MFDKRKRSTHNQNMIPSHRDDRPVHCAKKLDHDFLDVVVGEGLEHSQRHLCDNQTLYLHTSSKGHTKAVRHGGHQGHHQCQHQYHHHLHRSHCHHIPMAITTWHWVPGISLNFTKSVAEIKSLPLESETFVLEY